MIKQTTPTFVDETTAAKLVALTERVEAVEKVAVCAHEDGEASDKLLLSAIEQQAAIIAQLNETTTAVNYLAKRLTEVMEKLTGQGANLDQLSAEIGGTDRAVASIRSELDDVVGHLERLEQNR